MVCIVEFKYKKDLIEAIKTDKVFQIEDPSIFDPKVFLSESIEEGSHHAVTNPKREWYADISMQNGKLIVK